MQQIYEDVDENRIAQRVLYDLKQIKSTSNYASKFQLYAAKINYDEKALMTCYEQNLKNRVKNMMMLTKRFKNSHIMIDKSIEIDNTQYERELEKKEEKHIFFEQRKNKTEYYSVEMKLNVTVRIKQRDSRKKNFKTKRSFESERFKNKTTIICYKCNKSEHYKRDCKFKKKLKKEQVNVINRSYEWIMTENCWLCEKSAETHVDMCSKAKKIESNDWCDWACTAVYGVAFLSWLIWTFLLSRQRSTTQHVENQGVSKSNRHASAVDHSPRGERIFHYLFTVAAFTGLVAYFTMASNLGNTPVRQYMNQEMDRTSTHTRQMFYTRYIYWIVAWPLVLVASLLLSGLSWATTLFAVALLEIWVVTWLCGALVATSYRWGYFAFGCFTYLVLTYILLSWGRARSRGMGSTKPYIMLATLLVVVWVMYCKAVRRNQSSTIN
jgi:hypothetical protein